MGFIGATHFLWWLFAIFLHQTEFSDGAGVQVLTGAGAAFGLPVYEKWWVLYATKAPVTTIYKAVGSYYGKRWLRGEPLANHEIGEPIVFAGSDYPLTEQDYKEFPHLQMIPVIAGALVMVFNIPGIHQIKLSRKALSSLYFGDIQYWDDYELQSQNMHTILPHKRIIALGRRDEAGVTETLTKGLSSFDDMWADGPGIFKAPDLIRPEGPSRNWPVNGTEFYAWTDIGMSAMVLSIPYSIGYVSVAEATDWGLDIVSLENSHGEIITPELIEEGVNIAMRHKEEELGQRMVADLIDTPLSKSYPLATFTYLVVNMSTTPGITCDQMKAFVKQVLWMMDSPEANKVAQDMSMVPLVPQLVAKVKTNVIHKITCKGVNVMEMLGQESIDTSLPPLEIALIAAMSTVGVILIVLFGWQYNIRLNVGAKRWLLYDTEVTKSENLPVFGSHTSRGTSAGSGLTASRVSGSTRGSQHSGSRASALSTESNNAAETIAQSKFVWAFWGIRAGHYAGEPVVLFECRSKKPPYNYRYETCKRILFFTKTLYHDNLMTMIGLMRDVDGSLFHIYRSQAKSSLHHILATCPYQLNEEIKYTLAGDVCRGMAYLHKNGIIHGILDTWNCLMDSNWTLRIANWAQTNVAEMEKDVELMGVSTQDLDKVTSLVEMKRMVFRHPDFYTGMIGTGKEVKKSHDLFSYAMVLVEVFTRKLPYADKAESDGWPTVMKQLVKDHKLPNIRVEIPQHVKNLIDQLAKNLMQVTFDAVIVVLEMSRTGKKGVGIVDTLMKAMEEYMGKLEEKVAERTNEMEVVVKRMDELLKTMLPAEVATALQNGQSVEPKLYESATIYFSDIVGFDMISSSSTPLELVNFLNALYTFFDRMIERYDVYKVETIGDAYMCASGLPKLNGDKHASEICKMALSLLKSALDFKIPHKPKLQLKIRIGINTGSVMTGVVGLKMPRYCLFGDAVNVASRMESTSLANKIQASEDTIKILDESFAGEFVYEYRGETEVKGKGLMKTYWVLEGTDISGSTMTGITSLADGGRSSAQSASAEEKVKDWQKD